MARAQAHLAAGRYAEAAGAFRAVLAIDSTEVRARTGLADAVAARGQRAEAVAGLLAAAETCVELEQHAQALLLYGKALALEPSRMELHLDVAVVERAMGRHEAAVARVEGLAERYMSTGRTEEAVELLRFVASWEEEAEIEELLEELEPEELRTVISRNPLPAAQPARRAPQPVSTETVVCATVLIRPDGTFWFGNGASPGAPELDEAELTVARAVSAPIVLDELELEEDADPDMVTRVSSLPPTRPGRAAARVSPAKPAPVAKPVIAAKPAPAAKPVIAAKPAPVAKPVIAAKPAPAARPAIASSADARLRVARAPRPVAAKPMPSRPAAQPAAIRRATPIKPAPIKADSPLAHAAPNALVDRLRKRAGLEPEATAVPRSTKARGSEPILMVRQPSLERPEREQEEVTHRFRRPRALERAAAS